MNTVAKQPMYGWNTLRWPKIQRDVFKLQKRIYQASRQRGTCDRRQVVEEPCDAKVSRTVLKPSRSGDAPAQGNSRNSSRR
jgi:hypothetical protein